MQPGVLNNLKKKKKLACKRSLFSSERVYPTVNLPSIFNVFLSTCLEESWGSIKWSLLIEWAWALFGAAGESERGSKSQSPHRRRTSREDTGLHRKMGTLKSMRQEHSLQRRELIFASASYRESERMWTGTCRRAFGPGKRGEATEMERGRQREKAGRAAQWVVYCIGLPCREPWVWCHILVTPAFGGGVGGVGRWKVGWGVRVETQTPEVQSYPWLCNELEVNMGCKRAFRKD